MQESYIQDLFAERIGGKRYGKDTAIYKFEKIKRAKCAAKEVNPDAELFDLGVGEPDAMADAGIVEMLRAEVHGKAQVDPSRERIASDNDWILVWRTLTTM